MVWNILLQITSCSMEKILIESCHKASNNTFTMNKIYGSIHFYKVLSEIGTVLILIWWNSNSSIILSYFLTFIFVKCVLNIKILPIVGFMLICSTVIINETLYKLGLTVEESRQKITETAFLGVGEEEMTMSNKTQNINCWLRSV